jgi:putative transposase
MNNNREKYDSDITDKQWELIKDLATFPTKKTGRKRANPRECLNACLYVLYTGCRWRDLPHDFGVKKSTAHQYLKELKRRRRFNGIFAKLLSIAHKQGKIELCNAYLDASVVKNKKGALNRWDIPENTV